MLYAIAVVLHTALTFVIIFGVSMIPVGLVIFFLFQAEDWISRIAKIAFVAAGIAVAWVLKSDILFSLMPHGRGFWRMIDADQFFGHISYHLTETLTYPLTFPGTPIDAEFWFPQVMGPLLEPLEEFVFYPIGWAYAILWIAVFAILMINQPVRFVLAPFFAGLFLYFVTVPTVIGLSVTAGIVLFLLAIIMGFVAIAIG